MSNVDSHKVVRGGCETKDCHCKEFIKGDTPKCAGCQHAPVKHVDLSKGTTPAPLVQQEPAVTPLPNPPFVQPVQTVPTSQHLPPCTNQPIYSPPLQVSYMPQPQPAVNYSIPLNTGYAPSMQPMYPQDQQQFMMQQALLAGQVQCKKCNSFYPEHTGVCVLCFPRDNCKICGVNVVFMDLSMSAGLQLFAYCSPECRNKDLPRLDKEAGLLQESS